MKKDPKYLNIPNINFSLTSEDDVREIGFTQQRLERGFDDSETWSLRDTIALFIIPRLKRYEEIVNDRFEREPKLVKDINDFLIAMELISRDNGTCIFTDKEKRQVQKGLKKFHKVFMSLWW